MRPDVPAMQELESIMANIEETKRKLKALEAQVRDEVIHEMGLQLGGGEEGRLAAARYLYWKMPEVSAVGISKGLLNVHPSQLAKLVGPSTDILECDKCSNKLEFGSRTELLSAKKKKNASQVCSKCYGKQEEKRKQESGRVHTARKRRYLELASMPYYAYLNTPEWQARREKHLKSAGYKCQLCNAEGVTLDVHHRTYERRGHEYDKDLIVLCRDCHGKFHEKPKEINTVPILIGTPWERKDYNPNELAEY